MKNGFVRWFVRLLALFCLSCGSSSFCHELCSCCWTEEDLNDDSLVLSEDEPEHLVSMTGKLRLRVLNSDPENRAKGRLIDCWILKLNPESFEVACKTPVRASFQTPATIRSFRNYDEMELTGTYDKEWLFAHLNQTVTMKGYLWHAHTGHHYTPIMMDSEPWFK